MENRHDDTPVINDYTYYVFEEIETRGLQFAIPESWRPIYRAFLAERKQRRKIAAAASNGIAASFKKSKDGSDSTRYQDDFGTPNSTPREENSQTANTTRPLEE
jgi:hypothetical protein